MIIEITVPTLGESIVEATVSQWFKQIGDIVDADEPILELETDKVTVEVPAPSAGVLAEIFATDGVNVEVGAILGSIAEGETAKAEANRAPVVEERPALELEPMPKSFTAPPPTLAVLAQGNASALSPAVRKLVEEHNIDPKPVSYTHLTLPTKA